MDKTLKTVLIGAAAWSVGIYAYQRVFGVIVANGQTLIPGFLDPLGMLLGYPDQVTVSVGRTIDQSDPSLQLSHGEAT
jgi:hypothetical protein